MHEKFRLAVKLEINIHFPSGYATTSFVLFAAVISLDTFPFAVPARHPELALCRLVKSAPSSSP
jgi:hypothetical protein